jgi:hypothetical protein
MRRARSRSREREQPVPDVAAVGRFVGAALGDASPCRVVVPDHPQWDGVFHVSAKRLHEIVAASFPGAVAFR